MPKHDRGSPFIGTEVFLPGPRKDKQQYIIVTIG